MAPTDDARELTPKGIRSIQQLASALPSKAFTHLRSIQHSGLVRAQETAEVFAQAMGWQLPILRCNGLRPEDSPMQLLSLIAELKDDTLLVGHNPHLTLLTSLLLAGQHTAHAIRFKKAGLLCLERFHASSPQRPAGEWQINWYLTPQIASVRSAR